jgi:hypothetical protein
MKKSYSCCKHRLLPVLRIQIQTQKPEFEKKDSRNTRDYFILFKKTKRKNKLINLTDVKKRTY